MARPTLKKGVVRERVNFTLDPATIERAKAYAQSMGKSLSAIIEEVLSERIEKAKSIKMSASDSKAKVASQKPHPPKAPRQSKGE
jgi:hypothetical protein